MNLYPLLTLLFGGFVFVLAVVASLIVKSSEITIALIGAGSSSMGASNTAYKSRTNKNS